MGRWSPVTGNQHVIGSHTKWPSVIGHCRSRGPTTNVHKCIKISAYSVNVECEKFEKFIRSWQGSRMRGHFPPARPQRDLRGGGRLLPDVPAHRGRPQALRVRQRGTPPDDLPRLAQLQVGHASNIMQHSECTLYRVDVPSAWGLGLVGFAFGMLNHLAHLLSPFW